MPSFRWFRPSVNKRGWSSIRRREVSAWLNGKPVSLSSRSQDKNEPPAASVDLPQGIEQLLIRLAQGGKPESQALVVTTLVSDQPIGFDAGTASRAAQRQSHSESTPSEIALRVGSTAPWTNTIRTPTKVLSKTQESSTTFAI